MLTSNHPDTATAGTSSRVAWTQVFLASVLMLATLPGRTQGLGLITEPLLSDLGLDRTSFAGLNLWATLVGAVLCFPAGWAIDRVGLRGVTVGVVLMLGLVVWGLSGATAAVGGLFLLLLASRGLGQSALSVCSITTVARWFPGRAGFAMGVYSILLSVWFALAFGAVGYVVREHGWRTAWGQIAVALGFVIAPLAALFHREPTKLAGAKRHVTGATLAGHADGHEGDSATMPGLTLAAAMRSGAFWFFAGGAATFNLVSSGLGLFNEAVLTERGFDRRTFHFFLAGTTLLSLGGQFLCGWLTRRCSHQSLMALALFLYAIGLAMLPGITHGWHLAGVAVPLGLAGGMIIVIFFSVWGDLFGQRQLGRIQGAAQMVTVLSSALGPVVFATSAERWHSYSPLLLVLAGITLLLALSARWVPSPAPAR